MYKPGIYRNGDALSRDSGSESAPLLSSESRASSEPTTFDDFTETSDLDLSSAGCSFKYVTVFQIYRLYVYIHIHVIADNPVVGLDMEASMPPVATPLSRVSREDLRF